MHSSIFLPFQSLKLIVISRRRRAACGRRRPTPQCRTHDITIVLTTCRGKGILLNATAPSIRDCCGTRDNGCKLIRVARHFKRIRLPRVRIISLGRRCRGGQVCNPFSAPLCSTVHSTLSRNHRTVLFRGHENCTPVLRYTTYN